MMIFLILLGLLLLLFLVMLLRTLQISSPEYQQTSVNLVEVDVDMVAHNLSQAIQIKTISKEKMQASDYAPFGVYHQWLEKTYPLIHKSLEEEVVNEHSLLYRWKGTDPSLKPVFFASHQDVVPVDASTLQEWHADPFKGEVKEGFVWGRGAMDMKNHTICMLAAAEHLIKTGFRPRRDIYFGLGHDEEISGRNGARFIAETLKKKGISFVALLDEGGMIGENLIPGVRGPIGLIGIGEKEYLTVNLKTKGTPGHSSNPPRQTAIGILGRAIALLDDNPLPSDPSLAIEMLKRIAFLFPFSTRFVLANTWLLKPLLVRELEKTPQTNALVRTTHAATIIKGGIKDNILPSEASAKINFRLLPGDSQDSVVEHIKKTVRDPRLSIQIDLADAWGPSKVSQTDTLSYATLESIIRQIFGDIPITPYVLNFATDARHYQDLSEQIYHFSPLIVGKEDVNRMHGVDERISLDALEGMVQFYVRIMQVWGEAEF